ncbi:MAG: hypothetical protein CMM38_05725 [Rhodospirillaceae bacterium]|nr:hypothetical protein [Rhodospirillaceae bacterium]|tara:strand:+ start:2717 stop:3187 length:471 start_codon:yes stop_codon:yes gene_type:complete
MKPHRNKKLKAISAETERITSPIRKKRGLTEVAIISDWPKIIGNRLAQECLPLRISPGAGANNGTLYIQVSGVLALELQHMQTQVIERINGYFGYQAISRVILQQAPVVNEKPKKKIKKELTKEDTTALDLLLDGVTDNSLRKALRDLGQGILRQK